MPRKKCKPIRPEISKGKHVVIKIGTSLFPTGTSGVDLAIIKRLVRDIAAHLPKYTVTLVSSGAIGFGMQVFGLSKRPSTPAAKQSAAAVGQIHMMGVYDRLFRKRDIQVAQVLLTHYTFAARDQYVNAMHTLDALHKRGVVPIVNENDTVAVDELSIGDNDQLAAHVACMVDADLLILLTDVDGLCRERPVAGKTPEVISRIDVIDESVIKRACGRGRETAVGGMVTKLQAADLVNESGIPMIIANGHRTGIIPRILAGEGAGTIFVPWRRTRLPRPKRFIINSTPAGDITIDAGAARALIGGNKSLLLAGVVDYDGVFQPGDVVRIMDETGRCLAKGKSGYGSAGLKELLARQRRTGKEAVHRDNLVIYSKILRAEQPDR